ncbi:MAG TPA: hypothetical protein VIM93_08855 [Kangiella sp.]|uniref:hypothetical protein n=1 Tax=Kangiella sp. TaxID=1920245 RepID=UPI002F9466BD
MTSPSEQDYKNLLAYELTDTDEYFVTTIINQIQRKSKFRKRMLALSSISAGCAVTPLLFFYSAKAWHPIVHFVTQSPLIVASVIIVGLMSVMLVSSQEV